MKATFPEADETDAEEGQRPAVLRLDPGPANRSQGRGSEGEEDGEDWEDLEEGRSFARLEGRMEDRSGPEAEGRWRRS